MVRKTAKHKVTLTGEERAALEVLISDGKSATRKLCQARVLLRADAKAGGRPTTFYRVSLCR